MKRIQIINGPNLNILGKREPEIYGTQSFESFFTELKDSFTQLDLSYFQSNHEGEIIDRLHKIGFSWDGIVINPAAYTHYSYAIADAIKGIDTPVVEIHISDIHSRESFRSLSVTAAGCVHQIQGKGLAGYTQAVEFLISFKGK